MTALNILSATFFSTNADPGFESDLAAVVDGVRDAFLEPNISDVFPVLERLDLQTVKRRAEAAVGRMLEKIMGYMDRRANPNAPKKRDGLEALLDFIEGSEFGFNLDTAAHYLLVSINIHFHLFTD